MKICAKCVLPETYPGIRFDEAGVCKYCRQAEAQGEESVRETKVRFAEKFQEVVDRFRGKAEYDALMAYSGGKDSTYTLKVLRENWGLRVLALTLDNGFLSPRAKENIGFATAALGVDHIYFTPAMGGLKEAFRRSVTQEPYPPKSLERASSICNTCMNMAKAVLLRTAAEKGIPLIAYGWSPGQAPVQSSVMRLNPSMIRQSQKAMLDAFRKIMGEAMDRYLLGEGDFSRFEDAGKRLGEGVPWNVHPLAFMDYDEGHILREIQALGWRAPSDTDGNSSNCLLNSFANRAHLDRHGFHPYAFEVAGLVRQGFMSREEGLEKLGNIGDAALGERIRKELGI